MATKLRDEQGPEVFATHYLNMASTGIDMAVDKPRNYWEASHAVARGATLISFVCSDDELRFSRRDPDKDPDTLDEFLAQEEGENTDPHTNPNGMHQDAILALTPPEFTVDVTDMSVNNIFLAVRSLIYPERDWSHIDHTRLFTSSVR